MRLTTAIKTFKHKNTSENWDDFSKQAIFDWRSGSNGRPPALSSSLGIAKKKKKFFLRQFYGSLCNEYFLEKDIENIIILHFNFVWFGFDLIYSGIQLRVIVNAINLVRKDSTLFHFSH
jgi:hypothetical protein